MQRPKISAPQDSYIILKSLWDENKIELVEQFKVLYLNRSNHLLGVYDLSSGGMNATVVDVRLIFVTALKIAASSIIVSHNHPSGELKPSYADEILTQKIKEAGEILDIKLIDHLIVSKDGYYSFSDMGLL